MYKRQGRRRSSRPGPARRTVGGARPGDGPPNRCQGRGGYPAPVFQRHPKLTLVGIAVVSFVVVVALIQFAGDLAT